MSNSFIRIDNLKKTFGGLKAVDVEHLTFDQNILTSIIGPNGAGKTTLFDLISGFQEEDTGEIFYKNKNLKSSCKIYLEYSKFTDIEIPKYFKILKEKSIGDVKALLICKNEN